MNILAVDPGPVESGFVLWNSERETIEALGILPNLDLLGCIRDHQSPMLVVEQVCSYGMVVGAEVFETVFWTGRFCEAHNDLRRRFARLPRLKIKQHLCHDSRAKDGNIRQALIDRFGGKKKAIGKKKTPGPLYGVHADEWSALALAVVFSEMEQKIS